MRYVSFETKDGLPKFGAMVGETHICDLSDGDWLDLSDVAEDMAWDELAATVTDRQDYAVSDVKMLPPLTRPGKVLCVGVNYPDRNSEYKDGSGAPTYMSLFPRFISGFNGNEENLVRPPETEQLDYEGEIVIVIGKGGRRIPEAEAYDHIAAVTLCNEGTLRDWVRHAKFNVTQGKNWDRSASMGPWLLPFTGPDMIHGVTLETRVNGEVRQHDNTANMVFSFTKIINYISTFTTLNPGDMIVTGTPTGAGARLDPPQWLKPGDVVEIDVPTIGVLRNGIEDESL
jgi:2-keto-4-pentenoate hydratase/2-oxohepta-3-ene-1,7-dioic acid hydratase in catechol pathway